jgi:polyhydroxyalkanoate synthesis repressor PhaR
MASPRVIKKYPNRRLYDTRVSSYITLEEVRQLVLSGEAFEVRDAKTNEDLTRAVPLQIIAEHEQHGQPIFSTALLSQIIRFYGDAMQGFVGGYLENSLKVFLEQQHKFRDQLNSLLGQTPWSMLNEVTERNIELWRSLQSGTANGAKPAAEPDPDSDKPSRKRR